MGATAADTPTGKHEGPRPRVTAAPPPPPVNVPADATVAMARPVSGAHSAQDWAASSKPLSAVSGAQPVIRADAPGPRPIQHEPIAAQAPTDQGADGLEALAKVDNNKTQVLRAPTGPVASLILTAPMEPSVGSWMGLPVFLGLEADTLDRVVAALTPVQLNQGDILMRQGEEGTDMFVLEHGAVTLQVTDSQGAVALKRLLSAPAVVGEMALITREPRTATVTAAEPCRLLRIDKPTFDRLCTDNPATATFLTCLVGERLLENRGIRKVGKYEVMGRLGAGGVATVFEARHGELGTLVALKMLSHALVYDPSFSEYFGREGRMVAQLTHDNIVRVVDTEEAYGTRFIVMEKLSGEPLSDLIKRGDRLEWNRVRRILIELCDALSYAHDAGLLHRDVKSANVFLTENKRVKLLDFGIATHLGEHHEGESQRVVGTPYYMSPEQIRGEPLDVRSDLYSLGILAYELCAHELPYVSGSIHQLFDMHLKGQLPHPRERDPDIPDDLVHFILTATHRDKHQRFANCRDAADFLRLAADLVSPEPSELSSLSISYLPSRRAQVQTILARTAEELRKLRGVQVVTAHQIDRSAAKHLDPLAPGATRN